MHPTPSITTFYEKATTRLRLMLSVGAGVNGPTRRWEGGGRQLSVQSVVITIL